MEAADTVVQDGQLLTKVVRRRRGGEVTSAKPEPPPEAPPPKAPPPPLDERLVEEARCLGESPEEYQALSNRGRQAKRALWIRRVRKTARQNRLDEEAQVIVAKRAFQELDAKLCQELLKVVYSDDDDVDDDVDDEDDEMDGENIPHTIRGEDGSVVHPSNPSVPHPETDPMKREGISVGPIRPAPPDLVGDRAPRTVSDLYAQYPLGDDQDYYIRVERTKPKKYRGVDCAGFLGEIRGQVVKEADLQRWLGGSEYELVVYGPDPRGSMDANENVLSKALTAPIKLVIPGPPILAPQQHQGGAMQNGEGNSSMNPFGNVFGSGPVGTVGDPIVGKAQVDLVGSVIKQHNEQQAAAAKEASSLSGTMFSLLSQTSQSQIAAIRDDARRREEALEKRLAEEKEARRESDERFDSLELKLQEMTGKKGEDADTILKVLDRMGPNVEADARRQDEHHRSQIDMLNRTHEEAMRSLRDRHAEELRRADERLTEQQTYSQRQLDSDRRIFEERERELRRQLESTQKNERELADRRIADLKENHEKEIKSLERAHNQTLTTIKESMETRISVSEQTHRMEVSNVRERLGDAQADAERARNDLAEASDPAKVMEKAAATAQALGFEKRDSDAPRTAWERFATMAGAGFSQMVQNTDWSKFARGGAAAQPVPPQIAAGRRQVPRRRPHPAAAAAAAQVASEGAPASSQGMQQNPASQPRRRRRSATWATEDYSPPVEDAEIPDTPLGFQTEVQSVSTAPQQQMVVAAEAAPPEGEPSNVEEEESSSLLPAKFTQFFKEDEVLGFLQQVETSINSGMEASIFAGLFRDTYPEAATRMVQNFSPAEITEAIQNLEGSEESAILRRDGQKWLQDLWTALAR